ncbi:MAG: uroporphyrinogen decarboxylase [Chloroflexota bacterium]|nr:MAG: uroporphyrinogen decarboxylase [Chloroflexota bacterium]
MKEEWTSRRRVETALSHQEPDRVPTDLTITRVPYRRLRAHLGLPAEENIESDRFGEVRPGLDVLQALGIDMTFVKLRGPAHWTPPKPLINGISLDEWGVGRKAITLADGSTLFEVVLSPLSDLQPRQIDLDNYPWPNPSDPGRVSGLETDARRLYEQTDLALMGRFGGTILEQASFLRGYEQWLMDLVLHPEFARDLMNRIADIQIALDEAGIRAAGRFLTVFKLSGEDLGMQDRPLFSPDVWHETLRPVLTRRWAAARSALDRYGAGHVKLMLHSDGAIRTFIPDLIEAGIDILDPVQVYCQGMEATELKTEFGSKLAFHGAIDTQRLLPFATVGEVESEVVRMIKALGSGGGFILAPVHNVQPDVPPGNIVAVYRAAHEYGRYPL